MSAECPHCNGTGLFRPPDADAAEAYVVKRSQMLGIAWAWDDTVGVGDALELLGRSLSWMEQDRYGERKVPCFQRSNSRWRYPRRGLAEFLANETP